MSQLDYMRGQCLFNRALAYWHGQIFFEMDAEGMGLPIIDKVQSDAEAMKRARNVAAPINAQRFGLSTPCAKTGACMNCKSPDTICCQFLITRFSRHAGRIHVILVNDSLGF